MTLLKPSTFPSLTWEALVSDLPLQHPGDVADSESIYEIQQGPSVIAKNFVEPQHGALNCPI